MKMLYWMQFEEILLKIDSQGLLRYWRRWRRCDIRSGILLRHFVTAFEILWVAQAAAYLSFFWHDRVSEFKTESSFWMLL